MNVYEIFSPWISPLSLRIVAGKTASIEVGIEPLIDEPVRATIRAIDPRIVATPIDFMILPGSTATVVIEGLAPGKTLLDITLPAELGGTKSGVLVEVVRETRKRRGVRH